jgi:hypothetical protein
MNGYRNNRLKFWNDRPSHQILTRSNTSRLRLNENIQSRSTSKKNLELEKRVGKAQKQISADECKTSRKYAWSYPEGIGSSGWMVRKLMLKLGEIGCCEKRSKVVVQ